MAFIVLRRSRNTKSYYLIESYRDELGRSRKRTLCYLGREVDGTDTLVKALAHWEREERRLRGELPGAKGDRRGVLIRRLEAASARIALLKPHIGKDSAAGSRRLERERKAEEFGHWQAFERLRRQPSDENARAAKRAFLALAKVYHPDQGGDHDGFLRLKATYDRARAAL